MKTRKMMTLESRYGNLPTVRARAEVDGGRWIVPYRTIRRLNRHGAGDYYDGDCGPLSQGEREAIGLAE
jgi:hypothetical protein